MSLQVIKAGILDTLQDGGRQGFQHLGINTGGAVDRHAADLANALLGKSGHAPVLECHFPASQFVFNTATVICITGADFNPTINGLELPLNQPIVVGKNALLHFRQLRAGMRCYISFAHDPELELWLSSYSTNLRAGTGGFKGRALKKGDELPFKQEAWRLQVPEHSFRILPWKAKDVSTPSNLVSFRPGAEWSWLSKESQESFQQQAFFIKSDSDRMGLRLNGVPLVAATQTSLVSAAVNFGTIQLLPNGQLIVLMADHQTTGGYPRIGHVITAHLPLLAQKRPGDPVSFETIALAEPEAKIIAWHRYIEQLRTTCRMKITEVLQTI